MCGFVFQIVLACFGVFTTVAARCREMLVGEGELWSALGTNDRRFDRVGACERGVRSYHESG